MNVYLGMWRHFSKWTFVDSFDASPFPCEVGSWMRF